MENNNITNIEEAKEVMEAEKATPVTIVEEKKPSMMAHLGRSAARLGKKHWKKALVGVALTAGAVYVGKKFFGAETDDVQQMVKDAADTVQQAYSCVDNQEIVVPADSCVPESMGDLVDITEI